MLKCVKNIPTTSQAMHERRKALLKKGHRKYESNQDSKLVIEKKIKELLSTPPESITQNTEQELEKLASKITALIYDTYLTNGSTAQEFTELWDSFLEHAKCCDWYIDKNEDALFDFKAKFEAMILDLKADFIGERRALEDRVEAIEKKLEPLDDVKTWWKTNTAIAAFLFAIMIALAKFMGFVNLFGESAK